MRAIVLILSLSLVSLGCSARDPNLGARTPEARAPGGSAREVLEQQRDRPGARDPWFPEEEAVSIVIFGLVAVAIVGGLAYLGAVTIPDALD